MKTDKKRFKVLKGVLCGVAALVLSAAVQAAPSFATDSYHEFTPAPAEKNMLRTATPELTKPGACHVSDWEQFVEEVNCHLEELTDGLEAAGGLAGYAVRDDAVITWTFAEPVDLSEIRIYAYWSNDGRSSVCVDDLSVREDGTENWTVLASSEAHPSSGNRQKAVYSDSDGVAVAKNVKQLRINFGEQVNGWTAYVEVEAIGRLSSEAAQEDLGTGEPLVLEKQTLHTTKYVMKNGYDSVEAAYNAIAAYEAKPDGEAPWHYNTPQFVNGNPYNVCDVFAAYLPWATGDYSDQFGGADKVSAYPGGYGGWDGNLVFGFTAPIVVPSAANWTFSVYSKAGNSVSFILTDSEGETVISNLNHMFAENEHWLIPVSFAAAGTYKVEVRQFSPSNGTWLELSEASGTRLEFAKGNFRLLGHVPHTVTFDCGEGASEIAAVRVQDGWKLTLPGAPTRAGYAFAGWFLDGEPFDPETPIVKDITLTAEWAPNRPPEIHSVAADPAEVTLSGSSVSTTLRVNATDPDGTALTYAWSAFGEQPGPFSLATPAAAETAVTLNSAGEYAFQVVVSDGYAAVTSEKVTVTVTADETAMRVTFAGFENTPNPIGDQGRTQDPVLADYPWGACDNGYKVAWRSTDAGNAENGGRKNLLLDAKRPNAYGLDGYLFLGKCTNANGAEIEDILSTPDYLTSFELAANVSKTGPIIFWIDDPRNEIGSDVKDFKPGVLAVNSAADNNVVPIGTFRFGPKVARHPVVRIGILSGYGDHFKPNKVFLGSASAVWTNRESNYGCVDWAFFDVRNAKPGDELTLYVDTTGGASHINGIVFDSVETNTKGVTVIFY